MRLFPASVTSAGASTKMPPRVGKLTEGRWLALPAILAAYLGLAILYNAATPVFEASDEFRHFLALHSMVETRQLPVLAPSNDPLTPGVEAGQPPLYYLLAGAISGWVKIGALPGLDFNPHVQEGIPSTDLDNKNLFVHSAAEDFPYRGLSLAVHLERLLSVLLGGGTVWLTFRLAQVVAPGLPAAAPLAAMLAAFNPQFVFISASVDNDNLITVASTAALLLLACIVRDGATARRLWLLSGVLGVAMLAKLSGLTLLVLAVGVSLREAQARFYSAPNEPDSEQPRRRRMALLPALRLLLILAVGPLLIAGWWYVRNWLTYGDPTGLSAWVRIYGGERGGSVLGLLREAPGLFISYWGVFGGFDLRADDWVYAAYLALSVAGLAGLVFARERVRKAIRLWAPVWLLVGAFGIELAALARWTSITTASTGRLLFPAIAAVATLLAVGLLAPLGAAVRPWAAGGVGLGLLSLAVFVPVRYVLPAYAAPAIARSASAIGRPAHTLDITYGGTFQLLGYDLTPERARPGAAAYVDLYWGVLKAPGANYSVSVQLLSGEGTLGQDDSLPGAGKIATRRLAAGDYFHDRYRIAIKPSAPAPINGRILVTVYDQALTRLPTSDASGQQMAEPIIGELPIDPAEGPASVPAALADFGGQVQLVGMQLAEAAVAPGSSFDVGLRWRAERRMSQDYTVFVHLTDEAGRVIAQRDQQPRGGRFPTSWWAPGETVADSVALTLPAGTPPGRYQLLVGLYQLGNLQRLPLSTGEDAFRAGWIEAA
jgi:hypothetical protein